MSYQNLREAACMTHVVAGEDPLSYAQYKWQSYIIQMDGPAWLTLPSQHGVHNDLDRQLGRRLVARSQYR